MIGGDGPLTAAFKGLLGPHPVASRCVDGKEGPPGPFLPTFFFELCSLSPSFSQGLALLPYSPSLTHKQKRQTTPDVNRDESFS